MAYGIYLAALPAERLQSFRKQLSRLRESGREEELSITQVEVEKIVMSTHALVSYGTTDPELTRIVSELFDGGEILDEWYWHPFRPPMVQTYDQIKPLYRALQKRWDELRQELRAEEFSYFEADFRPIFDLLAMADERQYPLLTFLDKPFDQERAEKVFFPVNVFREWVAREVKLHLNADNIREVFSILNEYRRRYDFPFATALSLLSNRYYALMKDQTSGAITPAEATQEMASIRQGLIELAGRMNSWLQTGTDKELTLDKAEQEQRVLTLLEQLDKGTGPALKKILDRVRTSLKYFTGLFTR